MPPSLTPQSHLPLPRFAAFAEALRAEAVSNATLDPTFEAEMEKAYREPETYLRAHAHSLGQRGIPADDPEFLQYAALDELIDRGVAVLLSPEEDDDEDFAATFAHAFPVAPTAEDADFGEDAEDDDPYARWAEAYREAGYRLLRYDFAGDDSLYLSVARDPAWRKIAVSARGIGIFVESVGDHDARFDPEFVQEVEEACAREGKPYRILPDPRLARDLEPDEHALVEFTGEYKGRAAVFQALLVPLRVRYLEAVYDQALLETNAKFPGFSEAYEDPALRAVFVGLETAERYLDERMDALEEARALVVRESLEVDAEGQEGILIDAAIDVDRISEEVLADFVARFRTGQFVPATAARSFPKSAATRRTRDR